MESNGLKKRRPEADERSGVEYDAAEGGAHMKDTRGAVWSRNWCQNAVTAITSPPGLRWGSVQDSWKGVEMGVGEKNPSSFQSGVAQFSPSLLAFRRCKQKKKRICAPPPLCVLQKKPKE